ncbi:MAG: hypothetical protein M3Z85_11530 [Acidobacteriota bacterium]|nr:hypothetical protein [Acidobacteriota bacterium]
MTPALFDLPLRTGEAAQLASLIFEHADGKPLNDELRNRLAGRAAQLRMHSIRPYFGSLERDPVHHSTYYLAVDGLESQPLLMHVASATAPASALFPKAFLIGRMQAAGSGRREIVVNASPFGPDDSERVLTFAEEVNRTFLPRPQGSRPAISVGGEVVRARLPAVFEAFRSIFKTKGVNVASVRAPETAAIWAAVRTGWREGYTLDAGVLNALLADKTTLLDQAGATRFSFDTSTVIGIEKRLAINADLYDFVRQAKVRRRHGRVFDFDLAGFETPADLSAALKGWKERGRAARLVSVSAEALPRLGELADIARQFQITISINAAEGKDSEMLRRAGGETKGRVDCRIDPEEPGQILEVFQNLFG